jgi:hypothetical protein
LDEVTVVNIFFSVPWVLCLRAVILLHRKQKSDEKIQKSMMMIENQQNHSQL